MRNLLHNADGKKTVLLGISIVIGALLTVAYLYFNVVVFERAPREQAARSDQTQKIVNAGQITEQNMPLVNGVATSESNVPAPIGHAAPELPGTPQKNDKNSRQKSVNIKPSNTKDSRP